MTWTVASNIADRVKNLREFLGGGSGRPVIQEELAKRAGVRTSQISQWERGAQRPSRNRLERWAEREGWPVEMFQEGAPMPATVLAPSVSGETPLRAGRAGAGSPAMDPNQILARFYEVMADASRLGQPCPAELAVLIQAMHGLAQRLDGEPPSSRSSDEESVSSGPNRASDVPGW